MARTTIQFDISKYEFSKLSYCVRDPCQIIRSMGCGSYFVRKINKPDCSELKFMAYVYISFRRPLNHVNMLIQLTYVIP